MKEGGGYAGVGVVKATLPRISDLIILYDNTLLLSLFEHYFIEFKCLVIN